jgi:hypothetical protein
VGGTGLQQQIGGGNVAQPVTSTASFPGTPSDPVSFLPGFTNLFFQLLLNDGWAIMAYTYPEVAGPMTGYPLNPVGGNAQSNTRGPSQGLWWDIENDPGNGARYLNTTALMFDKIVSYCNALLNPVVSGAKNYYTPVPIVPWGFSWGGWHALQFAAQRWQNIVGYAIHNPATVLSWTGSVNTDWVYNPSFSGMNTSGLDLGPHALDHIGKSWLTGNPIPGYATYGTTDDAVGWGIPGLGTAPVASSYGNHPISNLDLIIVNAQAAGQPLVRNQTADNHYFTIQDAGTFYTGTGPTALSGLTSLPVYNDAGTFAPINFISGQTAVYASDNAWHTFTFTGMSGLSFTGVTVSSPGSATISQGAPVCAVGNGLASGNPFSEFYWFQQHMDPICPNTY